MRLLLLLSAFLTALTGVGAPTRALAANAHQAAGLVQTAERSAQTGAAVHRPANIRPAISLTETPAVAPAPAVPRLYLNRLRV